MRPLCGVQNERRSHELNGEIWWTDTELQTGDRVVIYTDGFSRRLVMVFILSHKLRV